MARINWIVFGLFIVLTGCKHEILSGTPGAGNDSIVNSVTCSSDTVYFQQAVLPILVSNCAVSGCHNSVTREEGLVLTDYANVMKIVRRGRPDNSELYEVITEDDPDKRMPYRRPPLAADQIATIGKWIQQGALNNSCSSACDTSNVTFATHVQPIFRNSCQGCHSGTSASGGIVLSNYQGIKPHIDNGRIWAAINHTGPKPMPQGGNKLSDCHLAVIDIWIRKGAPNN